MELTVVARDVEATTTLKEVNAESSVDPEVVTEVVAVASEALISFLLLTVELRSEPHSAASRVPLEDTEVALVLLTPENTESQEIIEKVATTDLSASSTAILPREVESIEVVLLVVVPNHLYSPERWRVQRCSSWWSQTIYQRFPRSAAENS